MTNINFTNQWKTLKIEQQPEWPDISQYETVISQLYNSPKIVHKYEIDNLKQELVEVYKGNNFIIQYSNW